jgi:hypothetical protein
VTTNGQLATSNNVRNSASFIATLCEDTPALAGDDRFQYVDEPANGRGPGGEDDDSGKINVDGAPYPTMVAAVQLTHNIIADETGGNGPVCDVGDRQLRSGLPQWSDARPHERHHLEVPTTSGTSSFTVQASDSDGSDSQFVGGHQRDA